MITQSVTVCRFRRKRDSNWETGIAIGEVDLIIDSENKPVSEVWDYRMEWNKGCFNVEFI